MTCDDAAYDGSDADFQRWYFGGSPPESDDWPRHAFADALERGAAVAPPAPPHELPPRVAREAVRHEPARESFAMA